MSWSAWLPILVVLSSAIPGVGIFLLAEERHHTRTVLNLSGALLKLVFISIMIAGVARGERYEARFALVPGFDFLLSADALGMLFVTLSAVLWLLTTVYAVGYLEEQPHRSRFFGFFSLCVSATTGIALAGNPMTFLVFYETLTLSTYPLVVHHGDEDSIRAGRIYLGYTLAGGAALLLATVWLHALVGPFSFTHGGVLRDRETGMPGALVGLFVLFVAALGVKTALVPLHPWLPAAMVAPAPVSALLHAVAVVKAGAFGVVRIVYDVFGVRFGDALGVLAPLSVVASFTIVYGSLRALGQSDLKKRLAYSTVSQVSYIVLGASLVGPLGTLGGLAHLVHQGVMKITLFFCAGIFSRTLGVHAVDELDGIGRRMPITMTAFTIAALGMIGLPPFAGFISKWYLGLGALSAGREWVVVVLLASTLLNAAYFLPIIHAGWFKARREPWPRNPRNGGPETTRWLVLPTAATAALTLLLGLFAASPFSVQAWAEEIVRREYAPEPMQ